MMSVRSIMTRNPLTFSPETTMREAMESLCAEHVSGAPVVAGQRVVGVVSMTDLLAFLVTTRDTEQVLEVESFNTGWDEGAEQREDEDIQELTKEVRILDQWAGETEFVDDTEPGVRALLDQHVVEEVMTADVVSVPSTADIKVAASLMDKHAIHRVLVIDGTRLKGIVSSLDVAGALTRRRIRSA